ncbi:MAG: 3-hydroxyacyl-CoA dehydrogenase [Gemmatimonadetes bacterium]|nr:3-hydroxyacyl-CoA dehydrogenase [Gemmatimonadota bacterium]
MKKPTIKTVAVVGAGVIGRSWIAVFARAGCRVRVFDRDAGQRDKALAWFKRYLKALRRQGSLKKKAAQRDWEAVGAAETLAEAVDGAGWVQESLPEDRDIKNAAYHEIDALLGPKGIVASSTSAMDMTDLAHGVPGARRFIVAHPVNPPHLIPVVEVLAGQATDPTTTKRGIAFLREIGQAPVVMKRFVPGFLLNRMQAALVREAVDLVASGVADVDAVDTCIRDGLGLRWAFMGPFATANTNADTGIREYFTRFRGAYHGLWDSLNTATRFDDRLVDDLGRQTDAMWAASVDDQRAWRDAMIAAVRDLKARQPAPARSTKSPRRRSRPRGR